MRIAQLDVLRCLAVFLVLGRHLSPCPRDTSYLFGVLTEVSQRGGWIGVDLFFVLSGFLVSGLLFREYKERRSVSGTRFLIRRGFKIYPAFWVMLGATLIVSASLHHTISRSALLGEIFFLQNYVDIIWVHTWSLAVEEHFYLGLAALVVRLCRRPHDRADPFSDVPAIFLGVAWFCLTMRMVSSETKPTYADPLNLFATHLRMDSLFFGVLLAYYWHFRDLRNRIRQSRWKHWLFAIGTVMLAPAFVFPVDQTVWIRVIGLTMFYLGSGALLLAMLSIDLPKLAVLGWLATIGTFSYSIYLWHVPILLWLVPLAEHVAGHPLNWFVRAAVYIVGSVLIGIAAAKVIEFPVLHIRDRLFPAVNSRITDSQVAR